MPKRIQRQRTKGWRMPPNTVYVGRPSAFGNPFSIESGDNSDLVDWFRWWLDGELAADWDSRNGPEVKAQVPQLRGKNLACWCPPGQPCHADVLLELAKVPVGER